MSALNIKPGTTNHSAHDPRDADSQNGDAGMRVEMV